MMRNKKTEYFIKEGFSFYEKYKKYIYELQKQILIITEEDF